MLKARGTVTKFRGPFGFIKPDDGIGEVLVHHTTLGDDAVVLNGLKFLREGCRVEYTSEPAPNGPRVVEISVIE